MVITRSMFLELIEKYVVLELFIQHIPTFHKYFFLILSAEKMNEIVQKTGSINPRNDGLNKPIVFHKESVCEYIVPKLFLEKRLL